VRDQASGAPLVDLVLDTAGQKGTGKWTVKAARDLGVPVPTIAAALDARDLSALREERLAASEALAGPTKAPVRAGPTAPAADAASGPPASRRAAGPAPDSDALIADLHDALLAAKICAYAQGMRLIAAASAAHGWGVDLAELARIWKGGCIIRARLLDAIRDAFRRDPALVSLLRDETMAGRLRDSHLALRRVCGAAQAVGVPIPALGASLAYYDGYRSARLPQNLTQAQRDAFGAHTYVRADHPELGAVHTPWLTLAETGGILPDDPQRTGR
jgi:6-phosphogluconate dehydrogenase